MSQPKPIQNTTEPTFEVLKRLVDRKAEAGRLKYGVALQPLNGRCSLVDLLEELVDGSKYALNEIRNQREILNKLVRWINDLEVVDDPGAKLVQQGMEELFFALGGWRSISIYDDLLGGIMKAPRNNEERLLEEVRRLTQANGDLRKERDRAVEEAQRQDGVAKGLRAELAKEKANASLVGTWEQAARKAAGEDGVQFVGPNTIFAVSDKLRAERTALAAHVERIVGALNRAHEQAARQLAEPRNHGNDQFVLTDIATICERALAATPAQSLAAHDRMLLLEVANLIRQTTPDPIDGLPESFGSHQGRMYALEQILAEADRIERARVAKEGA